jgi:hypothetical protein
MKLQSWKREREKRAESTKNEQTICCSTQTAPICVSRRQYLTHYLVMDLLLVNRRLLLIIAAPDDVVLLVEVGAFISDRKDLASIADLFPADAKGIARDPDDVELRSDSRVVVGVLFDLAGVHNRVGLRHDAAEGLVVGVDVRAQPFGEEVGALVGSGASEGWVLLGSFFCCDALGVVAVLDEETLLFGGDRLGESFQVWSDGAVEADVVQRGEDEHDDHEDQWAESATGIHVHVRSADAVGRHLRGAATGHCEQTNEADLRNIETDKDLLQGARVHGSLGVDVDVVDVEHVVAVCAVEEVQSNGREEQDKRSDSSVADCDDL